MTTLLQLLSNYYKAKLDSERIYNEYVQSQYEFASLDELNNNKGDAKRIVDETLFLQRQIAQLNKQLQLSFQENKKLLNVQKNQKALYKSKLSSKDALIDGLKLKLKVEQIPVDKHKKERTPPTGSDGQHHTLTAAHTSKPTIHLLSPIVNRDKPNNQTNIRDGNDPDSPTQRRSKGLRSLLSSGKNTIFDSISKNLDDEINENGPIRNDITSSKTAGKSSSVSLVLQKPSEPRNERNDIVLKEHILRPKDDQNIMSSRKLDNIELSSIGDSTIVTSRGSTAHANNILGNEDDNHGITKLKRVNMLTSSPVKSDSTTNKKRKLARQRITTLPNSDEELSNNLNVDEYV